MTGSSPTPRAAQRGLDEEPEPVRDDLDRDPGRLGAPDERHEPGVVGLLGGGREQVGRVGIEHRHLEGHQPARAHQPGVVGGGLGLPGTGDVARP